MSSSLARSKNIDTMNLFELFSSTDSGIHSENVSRKHTNKIDPADLFFSDSFSLYFCRWSQRRLIGWAKHKSARPKNFLYQTECKWKRQREGGGSYNNVMSPAALVKKWKHRSLLISPV